MLSEVNFTHAITLHSAAVLSDILDRIEEAVRRRIRRSGTPETHAAGLAWSAEDQKALRGAAKCYRKQLKAYHAALGSKSYKQLLEAQDRILSSFAGRLIAVVRASDERKDVVPFVQLETWAQELSLDEAYGETVLVRPEPKPGKPGAWRPIVKSGIRRREQQIILCDLLALAIGDSTCDSTVRGAGGEAKLFDGIKSAIAEGYVYLAALDVRDFFPSLRPGHLTDHPLPKWIVRNLLFLPPETPIRFVDPTWDVDLTEHIIMSGSKADLPCIYPYTMEDIGSKLKTVRQGLLQGDVCAPQIARTVLGRELRLALEPWDVGYGSHLDNILIGARSLAELQASIQALTARLQSHPAGPLELHDYQVHHVEDSFYFLGYRITRRLSGDIYIRPGLERFDRFRARLFALLDASGALTKEELTKVGAAYAKRWFAAHPAWMRSDQSWDYVLSEVELVVNRFMHAEYEACTGPWLASDINLDLVQMSEPQP